LFTSLWCVVVIDEFIPASWRFLKLLRSSEVLAEINEEEFSGLSPV
jgi:hypothetical protein